MVEKEKKLVLVPPVFCARTNTLQVRPLTQLPELPLVVPFLPSAVTGKSIQCRLSEPAPKKNAHCLAYMMEMQHQGSQHLGANLHIIWDLPSLERKVHKQ